MKLLPQLVKKSSIRWWRLLYFAIAVVCLITAIATGIFLYRNIYLTIAQTDEIILLRNEVAPEAIDREVVENVLSHLEKKVSTSTPLITSQTHINPFRPAPVPVNPVLGN